MFILVDAAEPNVWLAPMKPVPEVGFEEEIKAFALKIRQPRTIPRAVSLFITQKCFEPKWVRYGRYTVWVCVGINGWVVLSERSFCATNGARAKEGKHPPPLKLPSPAHL
jgi:hypothetical protein